MTIFCQCSDPGSIFSKNDLLLSVSFRMSPPQTRPRYDIKYVNVRIILSTISISSHWHFHWYFSVTDGQQEMSQGAILRWQTDRFQHLWISLPSFDLTQKWTEWMNFPSCCLDSSLFLSSFWWEKFESLWEFQHKARRCCCRAK